MPSPHTVTTSSHFLLVVLPTRNHAISADLIDNEESIADASTTFYPYFIRPSRTSEKLSKVASVKFFYRRQYFSQQVGAASSVRRPSVGGGGPCPPVGVIIDLSRSLCQ